MNLKELRNALEQKKGQRKQVLEDIEEVTAKQTKYKKELKYSEQARAILHKVAKETQEQLQYHISDVVTMAMETIFDEPYTFGLDFIIKRGKTECELYLERDGQKVSPLQNVGGGALDVASFALRLSLYTLQTPRSRPTIILDEPFKFLSKDLLPRASDLLSELSKKLGVQFIIITHLDELTEGADKLFNVSIRKGVSNVG